MKSWVEKDLQYIWHPYTQMKDCRKLPPILIEKAKGIKLYDDKGNFYYDTISSWWCNIHGHNRTEINEAIREQLNSLGHIMFAGFTHKGAILLAEKILSIVPDNFSKVFFSDNGSTAVETALKMSFQYWQNTGRRHKTKFVSLDRGYHGDTIGTMSVGGVGLFNKVFEKLFFRSFKVPSPYCYRCPMGKERTSCELECIIPLEKLIRSKGREIAALILEPMVMAAGGMIIYPKEYLERAARICNKYGIHLILDEVATGFGRTGKMFACDHVKIEPDFLCLSKGITAGHLPLGMTITTDDIYKAFYAEYHKMKTFYSGHTYTANPIACSCAIASLDIFEKERTLEKMKTVMPALHDGLERFKSLPIVGDVRRIGMIGAIELVKNKRTKEGFGIKRRVGFEVYKKGLRRSLVLRPLGDIIYLFLPLCINRTDIEYILHNTYDVIRSVRTSPIQLT